jgi:hypothetical protein
VEVVRELVNVQPDYPHSPDSSDDEHAKGIASSMETREHPVRLHTHGAAGLLAVICFFNFFLGSRRPPVLPTSAQPLPLSNGICRPGCPLVCA